MQTLVPALNYPPELLLKAQGIRVAFFDIDGVLTDGGLYFSETGETLKRFNTLDGHGLKMLAEVGIRTGIITGRRSRALALRCADLGISILHQGVADKAAVFASVLTECGLQADQAGYMGDDVVDLPVMVRCAFAAAVPAAPVDVRSRAHYVTQAGGGRGAAREVCDFILRAQGKFDGLIAGYLA